MSSVYAITSTLSTIATPIGDNLLHQLITMFKKYKLRKRLFGLLCLKGNTTLCKKLSNSDCVFIDCDQLLQNLNMPTEATELKDQKETVNPVDAMISYNLIKQHILNICGVFKKKIVLVSNSLQLLNMMPVKEYNIYYACFSKEMEENIKIIFKNEEEHNEAVVQKFRILREINETNVYYCNTLKEVYEKTIEKFNLSKINL